MPRVALILSLAAALALAACGGGGDETTTVESGAPIEAADTEAIENLISDYGLTDDPAEGCKLFSLAYLAELGGAKDCMSNKFFVEELQVGAVTLDGDTATVAVVREDGRETTIPVVREGEPSDAYDGWKISGEPTPAPAADADADGPTETAPDSEPAVPAIKDDQVRSPAETRALQYRICITDQGAKNIKEDDFPSVTFTGGGSLVQAMFGSSPGDAQQGLATLRQRKPFFSEIYGSTVLFAIEDPLADDLEIGISCAQAVG